MTLLDRISSALREWQFRRLLRPGALVRKLQVRRKAANHGSKGEPTALTTAPVEIEIMAESRKLIAWRHEVAAGIVAGAVRLLEKCRFGEADKGHANILQGMAAKVHFARGAMEGKFRDATESLHNATRELHRHCTEISAPLVIAYRERTDNLWWTFVVAVTVDAGAGALSTAGELGTPLSFLLSALLGATIFALGCGAGLARQFAWVAPRRGWLLFGLSFSLLVVVIQSFWSYRADLAELAASITSLRQSGTGVPGGADNPMLLLLAVAGFISWVLTVHAWLGIYGVAPGVRTRDIVRKRASRAHSRAIEDGRAEILAAGTLAEAAVDAASAAAVRRRDAAITCAKDAALARTVYDREVDQIRAIEIAALAEAAGCISDVADLTRAPMVDPDDRPLIVTAHIAAIVQEISDDADTVRLDEGRTKLAIAKLLEAALRDCDRLKARLPDLNPDPGPDRRPELAE